jgi:putative toxin-antitoxin system antitoxin component (TIGR02293 family)
MPQAPRYSTWDLLTAAKRVMAGLPVSALDSLQASLDISNDALADALLVAPRTLARRRKEERLTPDESERVYRLAKLVALASATFDDPEGGRAWMKDPNYALGEEVPLALAQTAPGAELVERVLHQIYHGITV